MADFNAIIPLTYAEEEEEEISDEFLPQEPVSIELELERFRLQWHQELSNRSEGEAGAGASGGQSSREEEKHDGNQGEYQEPSIEEQAKFLFMQGVNAEQSGKLANAIQYYRRALQLVPDIESRIEEFKPQPSRRERTESESSNLSSYSDVADEEEEEEDDDLSDLTAHFTKLRISGRTRIVPEWETRGGHISSLPTELLVHILKWVVSTELDVQSLESVAMSCRGFFLCARDEGLWRLICQRIWGRHLGSLSPYTTYRNMYMHRPHMRSNGCYISRCHYYRQGEKGLDNLYKPFHYVEYFRYTRFFPDGKVLMLTSAEDPQQIVPRLRLRNAAIQGILKGYYRLVGDTVTCIMKRHQTDHEPNTYRKYRRNLRNQNNNNQQAEEKKEITFHAEFTVKASGKRPRALITWNHYSIHNTSSDGQETVTDFEISNNSHGPLAFSRVMSYTAYSEVPLA